MEAVDKLSEFRVEEGQSFLGVLFFDGSFGVERFIEESFVGASQEGSENMMDLYCGKGT